MATNNAVKDWTIDLNRLRVADAQEEGLLSDGDEPYFIVIGFRSQFNTPGSTQVFWNGYLEDDWANGVDDGDQRNIPQRMGAVSFSNVKSLTASDISSGEMPEVVGAVAIAMESDATPWWIIRNMVDKIQGSLETELKNLIEQGNLNQQNPSPDIQKAIANVQDSFKPSVLEAIGIWLASLSDPDDLIGIKPFFFAGVDPALAGVAPIPVLTDKTFEIGKNPIVFSGDGATYEVTTLISSTPSKVFTYQGDNGANNKQGVSDANNEMYGYGGNDTLYGSNWYDTLYGGDQDDQLYGYAKQDFLYGGNGNDSLYGGGGGDNLSGNDGNDYLQGDGNAIDFGNDTLYGGAGNDTLYGDGGKDYLSGEAGNDLLYGGDGNDTMYGGSGNDTLDGGTGIDSMSGGTGDDYYYVDSTSDQVIEYADEGYDTVQSTVTYTLGANVEKLNLTGTDNINGTGNSLDNVLWGNNKNNSLSGKEGNDSINGYDGNDTLGGGTGNDTLDGGTGNDELIDFAGNDLFKGGDGDDSIIATSAFGDYGADTLYGGSGNDTIRAGMDNDWLDGGAGNDWLDGGLGNDTLIGGTGTDSLVGGAGSDRLTGYGGTTGEYDTLTGGADSDTFVLGNSTSIFYAGAGYATITDWQSGVDKIEIHGSADPLSNQFSLSKDYFLGTTSISLNNAIFSSDNLIAVVQSTNVNLSDFVFV